MLCWFLVSIRLHTAKHTARGNIHQWWEFTGGLGSQRGIRKKKNKRTNSWESKKVQQKVGSERRDGRGRQRKWEIKAGRYRGIKNVQQHRYGNTKRKDEKNKRKNKYSSKTQHSMSCIIIHKTESNWEFFLFFAFYNKCIN